jgi:hypothetical protein
MVTFSFNTRLVFQRRGSSRKLRKRIRDTHKYQKAGGTGKINAETLKSFHRRPLVLYLVRHSLKSDGVSFSDGGGAMVDKEKLKF